MNDIKLMNKAADNIRILAASMVEKAKSRSESTRLNSSHMPKSRMPSSA